MPLALSTEPDRTEDLLRARTYSLLALLLAGPPGQEVLDRLQGIETEEAPDAPLARAWAEVKRASARTTTDRLIDEYHELFIGLGRGEVVPYGSWYLAGAMFGKPLVTLRADLGVLGISRREGVREPEDHAAALCETMALLANSADRDIAAQHRFFSAHVGCWMVRFFRDLQTAGAADFYGAVGRLGEAFLKVEEAYLGTGEK